MKSGRPLTTGEISGYCHVTDRAVLKWIDEGKLKAYRTPGHHCRVLPESFLTFLNAYNMPVPVDFKEMVPIRVKILVVDHNAEMRNAVRQILAEYKQSLVAEAGDSFSAGMQCTVFQPDLLIVNPQGTGVDVGEMCSSLRHDSSYSPPVKVLVVLEEADVSGMDRHLKAGANDCIFKPFRDEVLLLKVDRLVTT